MPPTYNISLQNADDRITYTAENGTVVFDVFSPRGIGSVRITSTNASAPVEIVFRMHLRALEHFKFSFGEQNVGIEIPSSGDHTPRENVPPDSALYMPVKIVSRDNAYPLQEGYIEIRAPRAFFDSGAREFTIEWIDFYR